MNRLQRQHTYNLLANRAMDINSRDRQKDHYVISDEYTKKFKNMNGGNAPIDYLRGINPNNHKFKHIKYNSFIDITNDLNQPLLNEQIWNEISKLHNERGKVKRIAKRPAYNVVSLPQPEEFEPEFEDVENNPTRYSYSGNGNTIGDARFGGGNTIGDARFGGSVNLQEGNNPLRHVFEQFSSLFRGKGSANYRKPIIERMPVDPRNKRIIKGQAGGVVRMTKPFNPFDTTAVPAIPILHNRPYMPTRQPVYDQVFRKGQLGGNLHSQVYNNLHSYDWVFEAFKNLSKLLTGKGK
jgi:hypothetical protein